MCRRLPFCLLLLLLLCPRLGGQTLAHRGWAGSGIAVPPWWTSAVFYQVDPLTFQDSDGDGFGDLPGLVSRLDYLKDLGVDAILLSPFTLEPGSTHSAREEDAFAQLLGEAARRQMRGLVDLPLDAEAAAPDAVAAQARFWLGRGVAGLRLTGLNTADALSLARLARVRQACAGFSGGRVLLASVAQGATYSMAMPAVAWRGAGRASPASRNAGLTLAADTSTLPLLDLAVRLPSLTPEVVRGLLAGMRSGIAPLIVSDPASRARSLDRYGADQARAVAALLLTTRAEPLLLYGQELGMATTPPSTTAAGEPLPMQWGGAHGFTDGVPWIEPGANAATANVAAEDADAASLLHWYRRLSVLHRANPALRGGSLTVLATAAPEIVAWVRQSPRSGELAPPVVVAVNLSGHAVVVSLASALAGAGVRAGVGTRLRMLAAPAEPASGQAQASEAVTALGLPAYGVFVGEVQTQPGLEFAPAPYVRARRRGR